MGRILNSSKLFWLLGILLVILVIFLPGYTKLQELRDKNKQLEARIGEVEEENAVLESQISRIQKDPVYQEEVVRERFGVVRKGEIIYKLDSEQ